LELHPAVSIKQEEGGLKLNVKNPEDLEERALWGTFSSHVANMIEGVTKGFEKKLEINGVGFRWAVKGTTLTMAIGFSHDVEYELPAGIEAKVAKNTLTISGIDKYLVGQVAAEIRGLKKPEPYKGKGIKYADEHIRRKVGKQVAGSSGGA
jgi:large subunit ribosomal protein L6